MGKQEKKEEAKEDEEAHFKDENCVLDDALKNGIRHMWLASINECVTLRV